MTKENVIITETDSYICITPLYSLTDTIMEDFKTSVSQWCENKEKHIVVDFKNVHLLSSRAITHLIKLYKIQHDKNKMFALVNLKKETEDLLIAVNITKIISVFSSIEEFIISLEEPLLHSSSLSPAMVRFEKQKDLTIIHLEIQGDGIDTSKTDFSTIFSEVEHKNVIIDLGNIINLDEKSISAFTEFADTCVNKNGHLVLAAVNTLTKDLFLLLGIEDKFNFVETISEGTTFISVGQKHKKNRK